MVETDAFFFSSDFSWSLWGNRGEGSAKDIINQHIQKLHEYNEIKDVGQVILGKVNQKRTKSKKNAMRL